MTESFAQLFEQSLANQRIRPGMILSGLVVDVGSDMVVVNVGLKSEAVIPLEQFKNERGEIEVKAGDTVEVALDAMEDGSGETRLSREKAKRARTWTRLEESFNKSEIVTGTITGRVKGGFTVEIDNVRAFLPGSLVDVRPVRDTAYLEGKSLEFKVIKLDQKRNNVVVSRRAVVEQEFSAERSALMDNLQEGTDVVDLDGEAALDAPGDDAADDLARLESFLESRPCAGAFGLLAREARFARTVFDGIEGDFDFIARLDLHFALLGAELFGGYDGLGLEAYVDDHVVRADLDDVAGQDGARLDPLAGNALLE